MMILQGRIKVELLEALPRLLGPFNEEVANFATSHLSNRRVNVRCNTMVKELTSSSAAIVQEKGSEPEALEFGLLVWAAGISTRPLVANLIKSIGEANGQTSKRGLVVDDRMRVKGTIVRFYLPN